MWIVHQNLMKSLSPIVDCGVHYIDVMCQMARSKPVQVNANEVRLTDEIPPHNYELRPDLNTIQGNIVYGEVGSFQRDILEEEFNNNKIFGKRYENRKKCLIVDEFDNMCLDRARRILYLSHEIQSLKWLETLFINI
ncbi:unnamed protein product [Didymodactylos carnosus]|uniref:Uncharacterized protein n=1 Tax=Didymodactylos carnosus TaxID=1234261 RepID=A0A815QZ91_9BILA|nr:unnamed protein product [Didymodactylos carnosus]CAF1470314.1 unnamed protein product [Didymodactylos carnosus]CAF3612258.1 unnamed protein product [Didymodactylos carnosus]CAF4338262.1 unnamed protein product [Didymodactylos carnosus]